MGVVGEKWLQNPKFDAKRRKEHRKNRITFNILAHFLILLLVYLGLNKHNVWYGIIGANSLVSCLKMGIHILVMSWCNYILFHFGLGYVPCISQCDVSGCDTNRALN